MRNIFYTLFAFFFVNSKTFAYDLLWTDKIDDKFKNGWVDLVTKIDNILGYFIWLLYLISVVIVVWWGFLILTSGWEEEKVKSWKKYVIYALVWLVVIFLASQFINWIIDTMTATDIVWKKSK